MKTYAGYKTLTLTPTGLEIDVTGQQFTPIPQTVQPNTPDTVFPPNVSPDGTTSPPATQIVSLNYEVFTLKPDGQVWLGPRQEGNNDGDILAVSAGQIFVRGRTDKIWYRWQGNSQWVATSTSVPVGVVVPGPIVPPPFTPSPDGKAIRIQNIGDSLVDSSGAVWTAKQNFGLLFPVRNGVSNDSFGYCDTMFVCGGEIYMLHDAWKGKLNATGFVQVETTPCTPDVVPIPVPVPNPPGPVIYNRDGNKGKLSNLASTMEQVGPLSFKFTATSVIDPNAPPPVRAVLPEDVLWEFPGNNFVYGNPVIRTFENLDPKYVNVFIWNAAQGKTFVLTPSSTAQSPNGQYIDSTNPDGYLVDATGAVWTVFSGFAQRNGVQINQAGELMIAFNGFVFMVNGDWSYKLTQSGPVFYGVGLPTSKTTPAPEKIYNPPTPGPSPTVLVPPADSFTDLDGNKWTLGNDGGVLKNGVPAHGGGYKLLEYKGEVFTVVYVMENWKVRISWQKFTGNGFVEIGNSPPDGVVPNLLPFPAIRNNPPPGYIGNVAITFTPTGPRSGILTAHPVINPAAPAPTGPILDSDHVWDFGDGTSAAGNNISHTWPADRAFAIQYFCWNASMAYRVQFAPATATPLGLTERTGVVNV